MKRILTRAAMRAEAATARTAGRRIGLVPTMGALHEGHLRLIDRARELCDDVVVSIFVNPLQFGPAEDFARYPRDLEADAALAEKRGANMLFAPERAEMVPEQGSGVLITAPALADRLCGRFRPGHFDGVLTIVAKLFHVVTPDVAVFGQKDYQQSVLIQRMVRDLDFGVRIDVAPTVRDPDGLALSSRNAYLSAADRKRALGLQRALQAVQARFTSGVRDSAELLRAAQEVLVQEGSIEVQYLEIVAPDSLASVTHAHAGSVVAVAAFVGGTRLIDNHILK